MKPGPFGARMPHEPSRMRLHGKISVQDILDELVGRTARIPSSTGGQLEIARHRAVMRKAQQGTEATAVPKLAVTHDPYRAIDQAEHSIGRSIGVTRCLWDLCACKYAPIRWCRSFASLQHYDPSATQGSLVVLCLRAYQEWSAYSVERGLAALTVAVQHLREQVEDDAVALADAYRKGEQTKKRSEASTLYADALLVLSEWVNVWNRRTEIDPFRNTSPKTGPKNT